MKHKIVSSGFSSNGQAQVFFPVSFRPHAPPRFNGEDKNHMQAGIFIKVVG